MRPIAISFPSGKVMMTLWYGTDDEQQFPVKCLKRGKPYVEAYGIKHELTEEEANFARAVLGTMKGER